VFNEKRFVATVEKKIHSMSLHRKTMKNLHETSVSLRLANLLVALPLLVSMSSALANPIAVTGCNFDVIYEAGATGGGNGTFLNESTALYEEGLTPAPNGGNGVGVPANRTINDLNGGVFTLFPYNEPNALIVSEDGSAAPKFATWAFDESAKISYSSLSLLGLSTGGDSMFSLVVFFTDGTNTSTGDPNFENSGHYARGAFDGNRMPDWFQNGGSSAGAVMSNLGRVNSGTGNGEGNGINLQQWNFNLSAYAGKSVDHVELEATGGTNKNRVFLAISGVPAAAPTLELLNYSIDFGTHEVSLTWTSTQDGIYTISSSSDLKTWTPLDQGILGEMNASKTSITLPYTPASKVFFRVGKE
jgi:hypothetical protein